MKFFMWVLALSLPFWLIGAATGLQLLPDLPVSALMAFCPVIAASVLVYGEKRIAGVTALLRRCFDYQRIRAKVWYLPALFLMPGVMVVAYELMRVVEWPLPALPRVPVASALVMFLVFFVPALGEELGWSGYALDPLPDRWGALQAGVLLGVAWAA